MSKTRARTAIAIVAIAVALFATLGEGSKDDDAKKTDAKESTESTVAASTAANPIPIGTDTVVAKGWSVKVNSSELNADATVAADNQFNTPASGTQFVLVNISATNNTDKPEATGTSVSLSLLPASGVAIDESFSCLISSSTRFDSMAELQPGATITGNVCFEVPVAGAATSVLLGEPLFTLDEVEDQRFFAIQ